MTSPIKTILTTTAQDWATTAAQDLRSLTTGPGGLASMSDVVWMLVRTVTTGRQLGGLAMHPDDLAQARERLAKMLDIAVAGGWRGIDLLETLMERAQASERLEALARKAGRYCDNRPDLLQELFAEVFGAETAEMCVTQVVKEAADQPLPMPPVRHTTALRRPMSEHIVMLEVDGQPEAKLSAEVTLVMAAETGYNPAQARDCSDGGAKARAAVQAVLEAASKAGYSRIEALRIMLTSGPFGRETLAACEHLASECGAGVIAKGMESIGLRFRGA